MAIFNLKLGDKTVQFEVTAFGNQLKLVCPKEIETGWKVNCSFSLEEYEGEHFIAFHSSTDDEFDYFIP